MKKVLLALIALGLLFSVQETFAAISLVTSSGFANNSSASNVTTTLSITNGNLIVTACRRGNVTSTVSDTIGNVFTQFAVATNSAGVDLDSFYALSSNTNASDVITCTFGSATGGRFISVTQWNGIAASNFLDATSTNATAVSTASFSAGPFSTTQSNEVIIAMGGSQVPTITAGSGYTMVATSSAGAGPANVGTEYKIASSTQTNVSSTMTAGSGNWVMTVGTFKAAASTSTTPDALLFAGD
jgi:hypothetical protein